MNEFELLEQLFEVKAVAGACEEASDYQNKLQSVIDQLKSRRYRVAVIGEFKRGKSSLVNALIGADVLPTDILPMTAAITRMIYGTERRIEICFKDGRKEERTVEELRDYATKYDAEKEAMANTVKEIIVQYPSVFCKNNIELLDTPGLNDEEGMTEMTLRVLGEIDAAIVVMSVNEPLSLTEQELILKLIAQKQIGHLVFVVTHLDLIPARHGKREELLHFIRNRITETVLAHARTRFAGEAQLLQKAEMILRMPDLFGVSSMQAMEGFIQDREDLLEESRFPEFKSELFSILTAAQSRDIVRKAQMVTDELIVLLPKLISQREQKLLEEKRIREDQRTAWETYFSQVGDLEQRMRCMDRELNLGSMEKESVFWNMTQTMRLYFIQHLSMVKADRNTDAVIRAALTDALEEIQEWQEGYTQGVRQVICRKKEQVQDWLLNLRQFMVPEFQKEWKLQSCEALAQRLEQAERAAAPSYEFRWMELPIPPIDNLVGVDVMPHIRQCILSSARAYLDGLEKSVEAWRAVLLQQRRQDREMQQYFCSINDQRLVEIAAQLRLGRAELEQKNKRLTAIRDKIQ